MAESLPLQTDALAVGDKTVMTVGTGEGMIAWVSAVHPTTAPGYVRVDFEDGVRCIVSAWKLKKL